MANYSRYQNTSVFNQTETLFTNCYYPHDSGVLVLLFGVLVSLAGVLGNITVCLVFFATPSLRTCSRFIVVNLCVADFLTSAFGVPLEVAWVYLRSVYKACLSEELLYARRCVISFSSAASLLTLGLVSIERFIVIFWPLKHKDIISTPRCVVLMSLGWFGCIIYGIFAGFESHRKETSIFAVAATIHCFLLVLVCYSCIFLRILRQNKIRVSLNVHQNHLHSLEKKMSTTLALIIVVYGICYLPYTVVRLTQQMNKPEREWFLILALSHSAFDPFIYFFRSGEYRKAYVEILHKIFPKRNRVNFESNDLQIPKPAVSTRAKQEPN
ncbi:RYamide receptor-like [Actinia tenebrosa]|uniref:RYamide receptor-like n=1 Tax=Actinia tenebrosa TaxID=6105 RepID=A0A6P8IF50_ACTTE|nr:RYamide receptor-like [Actinia tenebrosa]